MNFSATTSVIGGVTVVTLSGFTGSEAQFGSLKDGRYTLTALASQDPDEISVLIAPDLSHLERKDCRAVELIDDIRSP